MKKIVFLSMIILSSVSSFAQSEKFVAAMQKNISQMDSSYSGSPDAFLGIANNFERIAAAEKTQWLPYYYAALCRLNYGFMQKDASGNDPVADKASELIAKADSLQPNNSELSCLKSMVASMRLLVNPMQRFGQYGPLGESFLSKAKEQDPTNPRPYFLKGQNLKYTPAQYGGGCTKAMVELTVAAEKFAAFKPASSIDPNWGATRNEMIIKECK